MEPLIKRLPGCNTGKFAWSLTIIISLKNGRPSGVWFWTALDVYCKRGLLHYKKNSLILLVFSIHMYIYTTTTKMCLDRRLNYRATFLLFYMYYIWVVQVCPPCPASPRWRKGWRPPCSASPAAARSAASASWGAGGRTPRSCPLQQAILYLCTSSQQVGSFMCNFLVSIQCAKFITQDTCRPTVVLSLEL